MTPFDIVFHRYAIGLQDSVLVSATNIRCLLQTLRQASDSLRGIATELHGITDSSSHRNYESITSLINNVDTPSMHGRELVRVYNNITEVVDILYTNNTCILETVDPQVVMNYSYAQYMHNTDGLISIVSQLTS